MPTYILSVNTNLGAIDVPFHITFPDGHTEIHATSAPENPVGQPWVAQLEEGTYILEFMPKFYEPPYEYDFLAYEDNSTNPKRTIQLYANVTVIAYYLPIPESPIYHFLSVKSSPINVKMHIEDYPSQFIMDVNTPWGSMLEEGLVKVTAPASVTVESVVYNFVSWEDGSKNLLRTLDFTTDKYVTATYSSSVSPPGGFVEVMVQTSGQGTTDPAPGIYVWPQGSQQLLTALPSLGYRFERWEFSNGAISTVNPLPYTADASGWVRAVFMPVGAPPGGGISISPITIAAVALAGIGLIYIMTKI